MDPNGAVDGAPAMHLADVTLPLLSYGLMVAPDYDGCSDRCSEGGSTPLRTTESSASGEGAEGADDAPPLAQQNHGGGYGLRNSLCSSVTIFARN